MTARDPLICFVHIERAGGTTLHHIFRNSFLTFMTLSPRGYWTNDPANEMWPEEVKGLLRLLPFTKGIGGHFTRSYLGYEQAAGRAVRYVTFLRHPVQRSVSQLRFHREKKNIDWSVDDFLSEPRFHHWMTKRIAGSENLEEAKRAVAEDFGFVGLVERFDESLILMKNQLCLWDLDIRYEKRNANIQMPTKDQPPLPLERFSEINALDLELYDFVCSEVFPTYVAAFDGDLVDEIERLRGENHTYRTSRVRRFLWVAYRYLVYRNPELFFYRTLHRNTGYGLTSKDVRASRGTRRDAD